MSEENETETGTKRRKVLKAAAATGAAATGLGAVGGTASAQGGIRQLNVSDINLQDGLLNVNISNISVLRNFDDLVVTVIGGDVIGGDVNVNILRAGDDIDIDVLEDITVQDVLNDNTVQVTVAALSDAGDIVAAGSGAANNVG